MAKTLRTKKVNVSICWNNLRTIAPRDFLTMDELETTTGILEAFEKKIPEFIGLVRKGEKINTDVMTGKYNSPIGKTSLDKRRGEFFNEASQLEAAKGNDVVAIIFDDNQFDVFFQQFERWGRNWFNKLNLYLEFRENMNTTNRQARSK